MPEWSKGALMYQIYVDRFCNGDPTNDTETNEYIISEQTGHPGDGLEGTDQYHSMWDGFTAVICRVF